MNSILEMFSLKITQIQNNLLDLLSTIVEYEEYSRNGHQLDTTFENKVLVNKTVFDTIKEFLPKIRRNVNNLSQIIDKNVAENERLTQELSQCKRRESTFERQLQEVRNLYHNLKDEMDWRETCDQILESEITEIKASKQAFNKSNDYLKISLSLILSSSQNQRTVQSFMENDGVFREFMSTIRTIFEGQIKLFLANSCDSSFDPNLIEMICGISVNVFQCNDYSGEDIPQWIDCFTAIQELDKRFLKSAINGLHFICFAPNGTDALQKKYGIITLLAKCLIDSELKHEFKLKTNSVKVIRIMIDSSKDTEIGIKLFSEFIAIITMERFRQLVANEVYIQLKKGMAALLTTLSYFNTHSITED